MWIKMRTDLADDPAVVGICMTTGLDQYSVLGRLHKLWSWADTHTTNGRCDIFCNSSAAEWIDRYVECKSFSQAMMAVGWLTIDDSGISFPNFSRHNGKTAKSRMQTAKRNAKYRKTSAASDAKRDATGDAKVDGREDGGGDAIGGAKSYRALFSSFSYSSSDSEPEKSIHSKDGKKRSVVEIPIPANIDTPEVAEAWIAWEMFRREIKKTISPMAAKMQLKQLSEMGPVRAVRAIEYTISRQWEGLREPDPGWSRGQKSLLPARTEITQSALERFNKRLDSEAGSAN